MPPTQSPPAPSPRAELEKLAESLLAKGPVKTLSTTPKRVRVRLGGKFVVDTTRAVLVWEHAYYPAYYLPLADFRAGALEYDDGGEGKMKGFVTATLRGGKERWTDLVLIFRGKVLTDLVRVPHDEVDGWFEEDVRIDVHPKDPFKRVDVLYSSRPVRVLVAGVEVAHARAGCFQLYETGLPVRFYLPPAMVHSGFLVESGRRSACPYKGTAGYFSVVFPPGLGGEENERRFEDLVWYYENPKLECAAIAGCLCFYNERVDIELDGVLLDRPETKFS